MRMAAKQLKVSHTTVSRRVDTLEKSLETKLFDRLSDGYRLTQSGQELVEIARKTDLELHAFDRQVAGRDTALAGQICVTVADAFACSTFMPIFIAFMTEYPNIQIKIDASLDAFDLSKRQADVAIRFTNAPPEHLIGRKIGVLYQAAYARRDYVKQHQPHLPGSSARWIGWGTPVHRPKWIKRSPFPDLQVRGHFNDVMMQVDAAKRGAGIGYFPCVAGDTTPELIRLSDPEPSIAVWMLSHRDLRTTTRMRVFREYITGHIPLLEKQFAGGDGVTVSASDI